jgi:hypothetical protein
MQVPTKDGEGARVQKDFLVRGGMTDHPPRTRRRRFESQHLPKAGPIMPNGTTRIALPVGFPGAKM